MAKSPGDFTGKQKARLQKEAAEKQEQEAARLSMITASESSPKSNEVIDLTNQPKKKVKPTGPGTKADPDPVDYSDGGDNREEKKSSDEVVEVSELTRATPMPVTVQPDSVLVRARYDVEQATVGYGNHYTLEAGQRYKLPYDAAQHFAERELVDFLQ